MLQAIVLVIFPFCMVYAVISDMISMTIANRVSLILVASFALIAPFTGMEWGQYGMHFAAAGLVLATTFALFALGAMGGGDAKLMTATALWFGFSPELFQYLVYAALIGGALTLLILLYRALPISVYTGGNMFLRHFADRKAGIPYGVALGISGLLVYPSAPVAIWALQAIAS